MSATDLSPPEPPGASIVFTTVGSREDARRLARLLVERERAACVQMVPIESVFRWNDAVQEDEEILLLIKTPSASVKLVQALLVDEHPYDTPEVVHVRIDGGHPAYLQWLVDSTGTR